MKEPEIIINGRKLSDGEVVTIRCAIEHFAIFLNSPECLGDDQHGLRIRELYVISLGNIRQAMFKAKNL